MRLLVSLILATFLAETTTQYHEKRLRSNLLNINWRIARCFTLKSADASLRASRFAYRQRHAGCCLDWDRTPIDPALAGTGWDSHDAGVVPNFKMSGPWLFRV